MPLLALLFVAPVLSALVGPFADVIRNLEPEQNVQSMAYAARQRDGRLLREALTRWRKAGFPGSVVCSIWNI